MAHSHPHEAYEVFASDSHRYAGFVKPMLKFCGQPTLHCFAMKMQCFG
jgi:hypothetical protein